CPAASVAPLPRCSDSPSERAIGKPLFSASCEDPSRPPPRTPLPRPHPANPSVLRFPSIESWPIDAAIANHKLLKAGKQSVWMLGVGRSAARYTMLQNVTDGRVSHFDRLYRIIHCRN